MSRGDEIMRALDAGNREVVLKPTGPDSNVPGYAAWSVQWRKDKRGKWWWREEAAATGPTPTEAMAKLADTLLRLAVKRRQRQIARSK